MSLSEQDREALWSGIRRARYEEAPVPLAHEANKDHVLWAISPAVEQIVARHVAAALEQAAREINLRIPRTFIGSFTERDRALFEAAGIVRAQIHN